MTNLSLSPAVTGESRPLRQNPLYRSATTLLALAGQLGAALGFSTAVSAGPVVSASTLGYQGDSGKQTEWVQAEDMRGIRYPLDRSGPTVVIGGSSSAAFGQIAGAASRAARKVLEKQAQEAARRAAERKQQPPQPQRPPRDPVRLPQTVDVQNAEYNPAEDLRVAQEFRDSWLNLFALDQQTVPFPGVDPDAQRWQDYALSISSIIRDQTLNPVSRETPSVLGTTVRSAVQLALMAAFGGGSIRGGAPREVYKEDVADAIAKKRLDAMENAVREYIGPDAAIQFRQSRDPGEKVRLATQACRAMLAEQKKVFPNALLLNFTNPAKQDVGLELIGGAAGRGSPLYALYVAEPSVRVRSQYLADAYDVGIQPLLGVGLPGTNIDAILRNLSIDAAREARGSGMERTVLENLGYDGKADFRALGGADREKFFKEALLLEAIGVMTSSFTTLTAENIVKLR